ncbi:MAG: hypothetical protein DSZ05_01490 [Sulfurospirillum sp.]|nr:MAG: hypothetical protein DSZ05_01490 [Sulfurospirillum sp.]
MGSKIIGLIAVLASGAFIYYCIDLKKDEIADAFHVSQTKETVTKAADINSSEVVVEESPSGLKEEKPIAKHIAENSTKTLPVVQDVEQKVEKSDPAFGVMFGDQINIVGMFAPPAKNKSLIRYIDQLCENKSCMNDIRFNEDIKEVSWQKNLVLLMKMFEREHIKKGSIYINSNVLHIEGEIESKRQKKELENLIAKLKKDGVFVEDETISMMTKVDTAAPEESAQKPATQTQIASKKIQKATDHKEVVGEREKSSEKPLVQQTKVTTTDDTFSNNLEDILKNHPLSFDNSVKNLSIESRKTLDKLVAVLKQNGPKKIEILGYSGTGENGVFGMVVSQKKADIVKNYLYKHGLRNIVSKGMGAQKTGAEIEIHIKNK